MLSLKTKYAVYGAAIAFVLAVAFTAVFVVLLEPRAAALAGNELPRLVVFGAMLVVTLSSLLAFMYGRRLVRSLDRITSSAERISAGDYTQPVATLRRDELGDLERTVEQMRQSLAQTTITRNYLYSVLNSMADAVFVTDSDGAIKIANDAACKLTVQAEEDLVGQPIAALLETASGRSAGEALLQAREVG